MHLLNTVDDIKVALLKVSHTQKASALDLGEHSSTTTGRLTLSTANMLLFCHYGCVCSEHADKFYTYPATFFGSAVCLGCSVHVLHSLCSIP